MPKREMEVLTPQMYYVLLVLHQPMHGYEIMNEITRITNGEITVGAGSLYTLLPKFEKECYIQLVKVENNKKILDWPLVTGLMKSLRKIIKMILTPKKRS